MSYTKFNIAEINTLNYGSTGNIMLGIQKIAKDSGFNVKCYYGIGLKKENCIQIGNYFFNKISNKIAHFTGKIGGYSFLSTLSFLRKLKKENVGLIHLHNLHISFLNLPLLFNYIKKNNINVVWTLHDCWSFTGHCPYFEIVKCEKWKTGCHNCSQYKLYPRSLFDNSKMMYKLKKKWFTGLASLTIVTPSKWLSNLVKQSFLKDYSIRVINNGINLDIFKPTESDFREKYNIKNKFILLGVAFDWGVRKGLDVFIELSKRLNKNKFQIVLVGTNDGVDEILPKEIISINKTQNQNKLAEIYSCADLFVNPTREEVLGMVNVEANACGTPVLTFNTGGSPECISEKSGSIVNYDDIDAMEQEIIRIEKIRPFKREECIEKAKTFNMSDRFKEYIDLYHEIIEK